MVIARLVDELKAPSNHPEISGYFDSLPGLMVHLRSRNIDLKKRILQFETEISEKKDQIECLKSVNFLSLERVSALQKK